MLFRKRSEKKYKSTANASDLYRSLFRDALLLIVTGFTIVIAAVAWFANNTRTNSDGINLSTSGEQLFEIATLGAKEQGIYDNMFPLRYDLPSETIGGVKYYIASSNSSLRLDSNKNLNNFYTNQDLRPGNKGSFDIYIICRSDEREFVLKPCLKAYIEESENTLTPFNDVKTDFLYGHILFFTEIDTKGMYSNAIDMSKDVKVNLSSCVATQNSEVSINGTRTFSWGEQVAAEDGKTVYKLPVYWVWPEQFGNYIYTGNSYNKNLFQSSTSEDYQYLVDMMEYGSTYSRYFDVESSETRPSISLITNKDTDFQTATQYYTLYSSWYDKADEWIGEYINYIELGFELADKTAEGV